MRRPAYAAAAAAFVLAACGGPAFPQFSQAAYRLEGLTTALDGGPSAHTIIYRDAANMRVETTLPAIGRASVVFDDASGGAYVLNPDAQTAAAASAIGVPPPPPPQPLAVDFAPEALAPPPGVAVRLADADAPQPLEAAWARLGAENTRTKGLCEIAGERGRLWTPREPVEGADRVACITNDGIVLQLTENNGVLWEATSLQRGPQDASLFGVPAGYRIIDRQHTAEDTIDTAAPATPPS